MLQLPRVGSAFERLVSLVKQEVMLLCGSRSWTVIPIGNLVDLEITGNFVELTPRGR